jgi:hypothetical protein
VNFRNQVTALADDLSENRCIGVAADFLIARPNSTEGFLGYCVIRCEARQVSIPKEVCSAVSNVGDPTFPVLEEREHHRGAHILKARVGSLSSMHFFVQPVRGFAKSFRDAALRPVFAEQLRHPVDHDLGGSGAAISPAHPIRDQETFAKGALKRALAILVLCARTWARSLPDL